MFSETILQNQLFLKDLEIKQRDYEFYDDLRNLNKIISFVWPRRVGKTYLMLDFIKRFITEGKIVMEQVVFLNLAQYANKTVDPLQILDSYFQKFPDLQPFFVLDEVQDIANFRELVLFLFDHHYKVFISGSNSKLLASELSTHFRGRIFEYKVYPLTFPEVLSFHNFPIKKHYAVTEKAKMKYLYQDVFTYGAFPELVMTKHAFTKREILRGYFDILLYKDLIERYKIENEFNLQYLMEALTIGFTKEVSIHKVFTTLKSKNIRVWIQTLYDYYEYLKHVFYSHELTNAFGWKKDRKSYLYNLGFHTLFSPSPDFGQSFENVMLLELEKKFGQVFFKRTEAGEKWCEKASEIDFFIKTRDAQLFTKDLHIQACYQLNQKNYEREISPLQQVEGEKVLVYREKDEQYPEERDGIKLIDFFDFVGAYLE